MDFLIFGDTVQHSKDELFEPLEENYYKLRVGRNEIPNTIIHNKEFSTLSGFFSDAIEEWYKLVSQQMFALAPGCQPKKLIADWSESLLEMLSEIDGLVGKYTIYDILLNYWNSAMQDDCYLISRYGWTVELSCDVLTTDKKSKEVKFVPKKESHLQGLQLRFVAGSCCCQSLFQGRERCGQ
ncbi:hypothetical protein NXV86_14835 [Bacteroides sp. BFG-257]|uniref:hypothetical protein n=1 Tax=Bacteroides sp. BFG-257 TaxID=2972761 RepID=UPI002162FADB|nr:hypothetical protein [Bacteroides sp. BFG-257]UVO96314.1 hypothetical protein NXV86_14835 [Bacteroides sp. BFG-257]